VAKSLAEADPRKNLRVVRPHQPQPRATPRRRNGT